MITPFKLLVLLLVIGGVWYFARLGAKKDRGLRDRRKRHRETATQRRAAEIEDLVRCPVCNTFVPAEGAENCGREDCPQGR